MPVSHLSVLAKKELLSTNAILSTLEKHTIKASLKVVNDISVALDKKQHCASLFIDLSEAFKTQLTMF